MSAPQGCVTCCRWAFEALWGVLGYVLSMSKQPGNEGAVCNVKVAGIAVLRGICVTRAKPFGQPCLSGHILPVCLALVAGARMWE
jgi:hypothetical protein